MNLSVKFRGEEGPLFRLKAPVRAVVFPFVVGGTFTLADGASVRVGSTLPWGAAWRLQFWPWGASLRHAHAARPCRRSTAAAHEQRARETLGRCFLSLRLL